MPPVREWNDLQFFLDLVPVIAAGHGKDNVRIGSDNRVPTDGNTGMIRLTENVSSACQRDHLRHPVATDKWRVKPLQAKHARRIGRRWRQYCNLLLNTA